MNEFRKFWLVWSPTGTTTPSRRHASPVEASREAERLARTAPGAEFYVLETLTRVSKNDVTWSKATEDDGIPF
jgi:hypothetical protein